MRIYRQLNTMDCGPTCLKMIARYYGKFYEAETLRKFAGYNKEGVSLLDLSTAAQKIGFDTVAAKFFPDQLKEISPLPCILHWENYHFVILYKIIKKKKVKSIIIIDPSLGLVTYSIDDLCKKWCLHEGCGIALLLKPLDSFYKFKGNRENNWLKKKLTGHLKTSRNSFLSIILLLLFSAVIQLCLPFITQSIFDKGVNAKNLSFINIILLSQFALVFSKTVVDYIRTRILLKTSLSINLSILKDFWGKLMKLPMSFFDTYHIGDILQRLQDGKVIERFITNVAVSTVFHFFTFIIFSLILLFYSSKIFIIFLGGTILYIAWIYCFLKFKRSINHQSFHLNSKEHSKTLQLVQGIREIKLYHAENLKKSEWENIQLAINKLSYKNLSYTQIQQAGGVIITEGKNIIITLLVSSMVIHGQITLGTMIAVQYIIGQMQSPVELFISFIQTGQDARISFNRLNEIHQLSDEKPSLHYDINTLFDYSIQINNLSFTYNHAQKNVLSNISFIIPENKITAIVGISGSGKTTFLKILMKFYDYYNGEIKIGNTNLSNIDSFFWRSQFATVLQDSFIFNDTIENNIALGESTPNTLKIQNACKIVGIIDLIKSLPKGFQTQIGSDGIGLSNGQIQRILIARAVYKDTKYLFLDEATNALDANTEKGIVNNLKLFFSGKTVVIIAHRLSTVKNADNIIVFKNGKIVEEGCHETLSNIQGHYYELVRNQLV